MLPRAVLLGVFLWAASGVQAFLLQTDTNPQGQIVQVRWPESTARAGVPYRVSVGSFPFAQGDILRIVADSFDAWREVPTCAFEARLESSGTFRPSTTDRRNVIYYDATGADIGAPRGSGILAITIVNFDDTGAITDADIVFNGRDFRFSLLEAGGAGDLIDLQDVLTHEIGHLLGLDHTPLEGAPEERPTMNPFNNVGHPLHARTLEPDDEAGAAALYPSPEAAASGSISGRVLKTNGAGAFGVHVIAYRAGTSEFVVSAISGSAGARKGPAGSGAFEISGLPPGDYHVAIEPIVGSITHQNFGGIFNQPFDTDFPQEFYDNSAVQEAARTVTVAAGRAVPNIDFVLGAVVPGAPDLFEPGLPVSTPDPRGPYPLSVRIRDASGIADARVLYRLDGGGFRSSSLSLAQGDLYRGEIPGQPAGTTIEVRLSATDTEGNVTTLPAEELEPYSFRVISFSGQPLLYVALRRSHGVSVIDTGPMQEVARIPVGQEPLSLLLTPDSRHLFVANNGGSESEPENTVTAIETATHRVAARIPVGPLPLDLVCSADGQRIYVTNSGERSVSVIGVTQLAEIARLPAPVAGEGPFGIAVSSDGAVVYATDSQAGQVLAIEASSGKLLHRIAVVPSPRSLVLSPGGRRLHVSGFDGGISEIDTRTHAVTRTFDTAPAGGVFRLAVSPDGRRLFGTDWVNASLIVVDLELGVLTDIVPTLPDSRNTRDLVISDDGSFLYVANQDTNELITFDTGSYAVSRVLTLADGPRGIAFRKKPPETSTSIEPISRSDFDGNGRVDFSDFLLLAKAFGARMGDGFYDVRYDVNGNNRIDFDDFLAFASDFGKPAFVSAKSGSD